MLTHAGRPMRALKVLADNGQALYTDEVERMADPTQSSWTSWHDPLNTLLQHGYVIREGKRGGYRWRVTEAGEKAAAAARSAAEEGTR